MVEYCDDTESVLRCLLEADLDKGRVVPSALSGKGTSVSRLSIYSQNLIFAIFHRDFDNRSNVVGALQLNIDDVSESSVVYYTADKHVKDKSPIKIRIDPIKANLSHAEFDKKISKGLSRVLVESGKMRKGNAAFYILYWVAQKFKDGSRLGKFLAP